jgi:hypothetical protein
MSDIFHGEAQLREHFAIQPFQVEMRQRSMYELKTQDLLHLGELDHDFDVVGFPLQRAHELGGRLTARQ